MYAFTLTGNVPSKKNTWSVGKGGKVFIPADVKAWIDAAQWELKSQKNKIAGFATLEGKTVVQADFMVTTDRDLDNMLTTVLDLLQKEKVIKNDKHVCGIKATKTFVTSNPCVNVRVEQLNEPGEDGETTIHL